MSLINYTPKELTKAEKVAASLKALGDQIGDDLVRRYRMAFAALWYRDDFTMADVQAVADEMGTAFTASMQLNGAFGEFLATYFPGQVPENELASPVPYTVNPDGTITFDAEGVYPGPQTEE
jgi:hypothetical protein